MTKQASKSTGGIAKSAGAVSTAVMCSRVLGLIREQVFAGLFGAGNAYDAFVVAFRIPNLLRDLFGEGALSAAFVTVFTEYDTKKGKEETWKLASNILIFLAIVLSLITLAGIYFSEPLVHFYSDGFEEVEGKIALTATLTRIMFPFLIIIAISAVVMGVLNTKKKFFIPALSSSFFNLGSIIGGTSLAFIFPEFDQPAIAGMAWGTLIGGSLQLLMQLPTLKRTGFRFYPSLNLKDPGLRRILLLMLPATIGLSATQFNIFINTRFASSCVEGSVSWLNYAFRLVQLPIGVFGVAFSIAAMPVLAKLAAQKDILGLKQTFSSSLIMVCSLTIPASAGLIILSDSIIGLIFERGAFTNLDTLRTAEALSFYALGLFAYSAVKIMVPVFFAIGDTKYPVIGSFLAVVANICIILLTIDSFQHKAIALSTSCSMVLNFLFLGAVLHRKLEGYSLSYLFWGIIKILLATACMAVMLLYAKDFCLEWLEGGLFQRLVSVFLLIGLGSALYGACLYLLKLPELTLLTDKMVQRLKKS